jgi:hypothetical protein
LTPVVVFVLSGLLLTGMFFGYYGKERMNYFTQNEVEASRFLLRTAPDGALILDGSWVWPLQYQNYELYSYISIASMDPPERQALLRDPAGHLAGIMQKRDSAYFVLTRSQKAHITKSNNVMQSWYLACRVKPVTCYGIHRGGF